MVHNVAMKREGSKLVITIDLADKGTASSSGKTTVLASTRGNVDVLGARGVKLGINCYAYPDYEIT